MVSLGSLTSISSRTSIETYESLKDKIIDIEQSQTSLQGLVDAAEKIINEKFAPDPKSVYTYRKDSEQVSVNLDAVMSSMLACAEECGGESGKRYVASAIVACSQKGGDRDVVEALTSLGTTWLTHLLFIFKTSRSPPDKGYGLATPTISHVGEGVSNGTGTFRDDLIIRDGYKCVLTGLQDIKHPAPIPNVIMVRLESCHILRRAIAKFDEDHASGSFKSAITTFDILINFTRLPIKTLEDLQYHIDDASNGMMCQHDAHDSFDHFNCCLKKTDTDNVYSIKIFENIGLWNTPDGTLVTFRDHSSDFSSSGPTHKRNRVIPLPNPHYIAIHAAIAEILHMSGAGRFFDELLDKYKDDEGQVPRVQSWPELEKLMEAELLRDSVAELLQMVKMN